MSNKAKKKRKLIAVSKSKYPSSNIMLEISKDEYAREKERTKTIEGKAQAFMSAIIAIFTIYIPIIPFSKLIVAYRTFNKVGIVCITSALCVMLASVILLVIAFNNLYRAFKIKAYYRVDFSNLNDEEILSQSKEAVTKGLIEHYNTILVGNAEINSEKAKRVDIGFKFCIIAIALMSISAIALIIITGGI